MELKDFLAKIYEVLEPSMQVEFWAPYFLTLYNDVGEEKLPFTDVIALLEESGAKRKAE